MSPLTLVQRPLPLRVVTVSGIKKMRVSRYLQDRFHQIRKQDVNEHIAAACNSIYRVATHALSIPFSSLLQEVGISAIHELRAIDIDMFKMLVQQNDTKAVCACRVTVKETFAPQIRNGIYKKYEFRPMEENWKKIRFAMNGSHPMFVEAYIRGFSNMAHYISAYKQGRGEETSLSLANCAAHALSECLVNYLGLLNIGHIDSARPYKELLRYLCSGIHIGLLDDHTHLVFY